VYDTGGLSIKGKTAMPGMKRDCGGAAAILGAFRLAVLAGFKENLHAVFCLAENSVGPVKKTSWFYKKIVQVNIDYVFCSCLRAQTISTLCTVEEQWKLIIPMPKADWFWLMVFIMLTKI